MKKNSPTLQKVREHTDLLHTLSPREFKEVVAALVAGFGWQIQPKPNGADGGYDFSAVSETLPGLPVTWIVECKFMAPTRPIGVEEPRNLYGAKIGAGASNAMLVTNANFTPGAKSFAESKSDLHLIDYDQFVAWLGKAPATRAIQSAEFAGKYLRMDGKGKFTRDGGGIVNCQNRVGSLEKFILEPQPDGTFAIASARFPGKYLRMDGRGKFTRDGGGIVNCQNRVGSLEKFILEPQPDGTFAIASARFPGKFLRMDARSEFTRAGGGIVNCQNRVGPLEKFILE